MKRHVSYLDFSERQQEFHIADKRKPENNDWVNVGYGEDTVISHFTSLIKVMEYEFKTKFSAKEIITLAACMPGITVYRSLQRYDDYGNLTFHQMAIDWKNEIETQFELKPETEEIT